MQRSVTRALKMTFVALFVFLIPYIYFSLSLVGDDYARWPLVAIPFLLPLSLPLALFTGDRSRASRWRDGLEIMIHLSMATISYGLVAVPVRDLIMLFGGPRFGNEWVFGAVSLMLITGGLTAAFGLRVRDIRVPIENLDPALEGYKIVQISDLHANRSIGRVYVERIVKMCEDLRPDLIALTGDIADASWNRIAPELAALAKLQPRERIFYVPGNHEYYWQIGPWLEEFRRLGARVLLNEGMLVDSGRGPKIFVAGVTDPAAREFGEAPPDLVAATVNMPKAGFKLLLSHRPDPAPLAAKMGFDLQLSGHTHGGQFVPWTLAVYLVHKFVSGLRRAESMWIYVSVGTGTWGPAQRLGTIPELTCLTLQRSSPPPTT